MNVTAHIDVSTPAGRKIVRELEKEKAVQMEYPLPESLAAQKKHSVDDVFNECLDIMSEHYNTDCRKIWENTM